jgi:hypothetical protein
MAKIIIAGPSQRIHRFLLPPHSKHVMSHSFPGGGVVLARILRHLVCDDETDKDKQKVIEQEVLEHWEHQLSEKLLKDKDKPSDKDENNKLPDRFIRMAPYAAAPALKKHLKPDTKFLRVDLKEDGDQFYDHVQAAFGIESDKLKRNVIVVGGKHPENAWKGVEYPTMAPPPTQTSNPPGQQAPSSGTDEGKKPEPLKPEKGDVVYILAKSSQELEKHAIYARDKDPDLLIVGHIDVDKLAESYPLQTDTSYERTVGDICRAVRPKDDEQPQQEPAGASVNPTMLETLLRPGVLDHLLIRIGNAACLVASSTQNMKPESLPEQEPPVGGADTSNDPPFTLKLFCHPDRSAPTTFPGLGSMLAYDLLLSAAVVLQMAQTSVEEAKQEVPFELNPLTEKQKEKSGAATGTSVAQVRRSYTDLLEGTRIGVQATYRCFMEGFGIFDPKVEDATHRLLHVKPCAFFGKFINHGIWAQSEGKKSEPSVLHYPEKGKDPGPEITEPTAKMIMGFEVHYDTARSPNKFWRLVVPDENGSREANCQKVSRGYLLEERELPVVDLGSLKLVDRQEVEDYLYLQRLLLSYHEAPKWLRPLCIGVFGQPGAGKSFGVKQLVNEMSGNSDAFSKESITVNLSQVRSLDELADCFHIVRDACLKPPIPLVFFDEFDSSFEERTFGWLKYFLAPMQDGEFFDKGKNYHFGKAIFVFAGGVNHSFAEFNERTRNPDFCDAKGPDFISRLRGILNICSMNKPEGEPDTVEHIYKIRRAVFLKHLLDEKLGKTEPLPLIAGALAKAFLAIPRYKHGARSIEAILDMSNLVRGQTFTHSNLPPRDQLDMHVDAREFLRLAGVLTPLSKS